LWDIVPVHISLLLSGAGWGDDCTCTPGWDGLGDPKCALDNSSWGGSVVLDDKSVDEGWASRAALLLELLTKLHGKFKSF